jgi:prevent-host-death family protein
MWYPRFMATTVTPSQVEAGLDAILARVQRGEEVIITRDGAPVARIVPTASSGQRPFGTAVGLVALCPGWDDPLTHEELEALEDTPLFTGEA